MSKKKIITLGSIFVISAVLIIILAGTTIFKSYDIVFDSKGGTPVPTARVMVGKTVEKPVTPVLEGYIFDGWYIGEDEYNFDSEVSKELYLEAKWKSIIIEIE